MERGRWGWREREWSSERDDHGEREWYTTTRQGVRDGEGEWWGWMGVEREGEKQWERGKMHRLSLSRSPVSHSSTNHWYSNSLWFSTFNSILNVIESRGIKAFGRHAHCNTAAPGVLLTPRSVMETFVWKYSILLWFLHRDLYIYILRNNPALTPTHNPLYLPQS